MVDPLSSLPRELFPSLRALDASCEAPKIFNLMLILINASLGV